MRENIRKKLEGQEMFVFSIVTVLLLFAAALLLATPKELARGMVVIVLTRDALVTDYFELAGFGAAFLNAGLVMGLAILLIRRQKIPFTGLTMAVLFINAGFALFGKNPVNVLPMLLGTWLYAKFHHAGMNRYIYTALFGSCLAADGDGARISAALLSRRQSGHRPACRRLFRFCTASPLRAYRLHAHGLQSF